MPYSSVFRMQPFLTTNGNMAEGRHSLTSIHPHIATSVDFRVVVHDVNLHIPLTCPIQTFHGRENEQFIRNSTLMLLSRVTRWCSCVWTSLMVANKVTHYWQIRTSSEVLGTGEFRSFRSSRLYTQTRLIERRTICSMTIMWLHQRTFRSLLPINSNEWVTVVSRFALAAGC